jgi:hypothetical protein
MQNLLYQVFENTEGDSVTVGHTDFWIKGGTASGLNASALSKINNELVKALFKATDVKQDKELEI